MIRGNKVKANNQAIDTLIGRRTRIQGEVSFSGGLHVDGTIEGNIRSQDEKSQLTISETGRIKGQVYCPQVVLNGEVEGDVHASGRVELQENARVKGNVYYQVIQLREGAQINGQMIHGAEKGSGNRKGGDGGKTASVNDIKSQQKTG